MIWRKHGSRPGAGGWSKTFVIALLCFGFGIVSGQAAEVQLKIDNFAFTPAALKIKPGDTVTWTNDDDIPHSLVASKQALFHSRPLDTGEKYSFTFTAEGEFEYFCGLHPHMKGMIVVAR
jgi:plastocyanin